MSGAYLRTAEVAEIIRMSEEYVARQCAAGNLRAKKLGTEWRISEDDLALFMSAPEPAPSPRVGRTARQRRRSA